jgi:hypothetical protein
MRRAHRRAHLGLWLLLAALLPLGLVLALAFRPGSPPPEPALDALRAVAGEG